MCFHAARFDARVALDGGIVLFEEQDRSDLELGRRARRHGVARQVRRRRRVDALSRGSGHRLGALPGADLRGHRLAADRRTVRHARPHRAVADPRAQPRRRRGLPARPASRARPPGRRSRKTSPPAIPAGTRSSANSTSASASTPPPHTPGGRPCADHRPRRSRVPAPPPVFPRKPSGDSRRTPEAATRRRCECSRSNTPVPMDWPVSTEAIPITLKQQPFSPWPRRLILPSLYRIPLRSRPRSCPA